MMCGKVTLTAVAPMQFETASAGPGAAVFAFAFCFEFRLDFFLAFGDCRELVVGADVHRDQLDRVSGFAFFEDRQRLFQLRQAAKRSVQRQATLVVVRARVIVRFAFVVRRRRFTAESFFFTNQSVVTSRRDTRS